MVIVDDCAFGGVLCEVCDGIVDYGGFGCEGWIGVCGGWWCVECCYVLHVLQVSLVVAIVMPIPTEQRFDTVRFHPVWTDGEVFHVSRLHCARVVLGEVEEQRGEEEAEEERVEEEVRGVVDGVG